MATTQEQTLAVVMQLRDQLTKQMQGPTQAVNRFGKTVDKATKGPMARLSAGVRKAREGLNKLSTTAKVSLAAVSAAFVLTSKSVIDFSDNLDKMSKKLGISTDALQKLGLAAQLEGGTIEDIGMSFRTFSRALDQGKQGIGEYLRVFNRLREMTGINVMEAGNLEEAYFKTVDALSKVTDQTTKLSLGQIAMGEGFTKLIPLFDKGSKGIREMGDSFSRLGLIMTEDVIQAHREFKDQMTVVGAAWKVFVGNQIRGINTLIPVFAKFFFTLKKGFGFIGATLNFIGRRFSAFVELIKSSFMTLETAFQEEAVIRRMNRVQEEVKKLGEELNNSNLRIEAAKRLWGEGSEEVRKFTKEIEANKKELSRLVTEQNRLQASLDTLNGKFDPFTKFMKDSAKIAQDYVEDLEHVNEATDQQKESLDKALKEFKGMPPEIDKTSKSVSTLTKKEVDLAKANLSLGDSFSVAVKGFTDAQIPNLVTEFGNLFSFMQEGFTNVFDQVIFEGRKFSDTMRDMVNGLVREIVRALTRKVTGNIIASLFGGGGAASTGANIATGIGGATSLVQSAFSAPSPRRVVSPASTAAGAAAGAVGGVGGVAGGGGGGVNILGGVGVTGAITGVSSIAAQMVQQRAAEEAAAAAAAGEEAGTGETAAAIGAGVAPLIGAAFGPIGAVIGGIAGIALGAVSADRAKRRAKRAAKKARAAQAAGGLTPDQVESRRKEAANLIKTAVRTQLGGGLATPEAVESVSKLFTGDISPEEIEAFGGAGPIVGAKRSIEDMANINNINVGAPVITVNANVSSQMDIQQLADDLGFLLQGSIQAAAAQAGA